MPQEKPKPLDSDEQEIPRQPSIPRVVEEPDAYPDGVPAADYPLNPDPPADPEAEEEVVADENEK